MARKKTPIKKRRRQSFLIGMLNRLTAFVYTLFGNSRLVGGLLSGDQLYQNSLCGRFLEKNSRNVSKLVGLRYADRIVEQSRTLRLIGTVKDFFAALGLNVYGIFFMVYSLSAVFIYYISLMLKGSAPHASSALAVILITFVCSIPLTVTSRSLLSVISESSIAKGVLQRFLGIPEENLRSGKQIGGTEYMFISAISAVVFGIFTYFIHPAYLPLLFALIIVLVLVSASPEVGVVLTVAATPFLQFTEAAEWVLVSMILLTAFSYGNKLLRRRRILIMSAEAVILFLFCAMILAASSFAHGGSETFFDAVLAVILIFGGFFLPYSLMRGKHRISSCTVLMTITYVILCLAGLWNLFYNGIADGMMYSMREDLRPIFDSNIIYIADNAAVFGVYTVLIAPLVFAYGAKQKDAQGVAAAIILTAILVGTTMIYGSFEAMVALLIEFCLFWLLYSRRSRTVLILCTLVVSILMLIYPILSKALGLYDIKSAVEHMLPLSLSDSSIHLSSIKSTLEMLFDGNLFGVGAGDHAFISYYPAYSDAVSANMTTAPTLWLKVLCWSGIGGLVAFAILFLLMLCNSLAYLFRSRAGELRREVLALFGSVFAAVLFGSINGVWDDPRMLYLFWVSVGLLAGAIRDGRSEREQISASFANKFEHTDLELHFQ